jgi:hypothetical protein
MSDPARPLTVGIIGTGATVLRAITGASEPAKIHDPLTIKAGVEGPHGRAWIADQETQRKTLDCPPEKDGTVAHYIIEAPWAHIAWHSYSLILLHLRPMPGFADPIIYMDGATHEIVLHALNPDHPRLPLIDGTAQEFPWLTPANFGAQFIEITDALALERVERAVQMICDGKLSPDTDFTSQWVALFGNHMLKDRA